MCRGFVSTEGRPRVAVSQPPLMEETREFYDAEGKRRLELSSAPGYITHVSA